MWRRSIPGRWRSFPARANDVASYAFDLVRHECSDADVSAPFIHRLAAFFSHASIRLSEILRRTNDEDLDSQEFG